MHIILANFDGNPNIGLFGIATDKFCILSSHIHGKQKTDAEEALQVPIINTNMVGTSLPGVFAAANSNCLLVPSILFDNELKILDKHGIKYHILKTRHTALGNNILCNDNGAIINPEFSDEEAEEISKALKVPVVKSMIADVEVAGACGIANNKYAVIHRDASSNDINLIEKTLKVKVTTGTINMASPYIRSGAIANSKGLIVSKYSGGPEIANLDEGLGFIEND